MFYEPVKVLIQLLIQSVN